MPEVSEVMLLSEARERFAGKWLALEVVSRDENGAPHEVRFVDQGDTCAEVCERTRSYRELFIVFAGPVVPPGWGFVFPSSAH